MTTVLGNHEVACTVLDESDRDSVETDSMDIYMEPIESEEADTKGLSEDAIRQEHADEHPASNEAAHSAQYLTYANHEGFEAQSDDPLDSELADAFRTLKEPVSSELDDSRSVGSEITISQIDNSEYAALHPVGENTQPNATLAEETIGLEPVVSEYTGQHQTSSVVCSEYVNSDGGQLSSEQVRTQFGNSQSFGHRAHPVMYMLQNNEFVKMEHNSDFEHQLQETSDSELILEVQIENSDLVHMPMDSDIVHSELHGSEFENSPTAGSDTANMQLVAVTDTGNIETRPSKRRKKQSIVWDHFKVETVEDGTRRAFCNVCRKSFAYGNGTKVNGTSHLKRHIPDGACPVLLRQQEQNQSTPYVPTRAVAETSKSDTKRRFKIPNTSPHLVFDQDRCRSEIARMVIMHEYPLQMVEHSGFVTFVQHLQPQFNMVNFDTVQGDCVALYMSEKQNIQKFIDKMPGRLCLSLDMWKSCQTTGYAVIYGQYIDNEYKLHRHLLSVVTEPLPESDTTLSHAVATCLSYWNLDNKLCSITFNHPASDASCEKMRGLLSVKNPTTLNGQLLLGTCLARTLSSMAQDVLAAGQDVVRKIRSRVIYVKSSNATEENFLELQQKLQLTSKKTLTLDNITKWNTTYDLLVAACELKEVFSCLDTPNYDLPTMEDWTQAENMCMYLGLLLETTVFLTQKIPPSAEIFIHKVLKIKKELARNAASEDHFVSNIAVLLQEKLIKYWKDSFLVLAISVAMDPRFKMKFVEFSFGNLFGEQAPSYIKMADDAIHGLFNEYTKLLPSYVESGKHLYNLVSSNEFADFDMYVMKTSSQQIKSEIDQYLEESVLLGMQEINVIGWWKLNRIKYPTLSKMACDILSIPLSSIGPDYVFDTVSRKMAESRSLLRPETMEALMCAKDWLSQ